MKVHSRQEINMLEGTLWDKILRMALPLAATAILQQMFNAADIAVVGRFAGKEAMAAVGSNGPLVNLMVNWFTGISLGANVVIARYIGAGRKDKVHDAVHTAVTLALIGGLVLMLAGQIIAAPALRLMGVPEEVMEMALLYLRIYACGFPVIFLYNFEAAILRSVGNTRTPLMALTFSGLLNVVLNVFFVVACQMDVAGVALATAISNLVSSALLFIYLRRDHSLIHIDLRELGIRPGVLSEIIRIGLPAGLQSMVFSISNLCAQSAVNSLGPAVMAGSSAAYNIEITAFFLLNAFAQTATTFVSQNYGAKNLERCIRASRICISIAMVLTIVFSALVMGTGRHTLALFNGDPAVIEAGLIRMRAILYFEWVDVIMEHMSGFMRGYGRSMIPMVIALIGVCGTRIIWVFTVFPRHPDFTWLMRMYPLSWILTATVLTIAYLQVRKRVAAEIAP